MKFEVTHLYDDIINLPHHISKKHSQMSMHDRAAQFAPFAALTGYSDAVEETARYVDKKIEVNEELQAMLDFKLQSLSKEINSKPQAIITYFVQDRLKDGGIYYTVNCNLKKIDELNKTIITTNNQEIKIEDILEIE